MQPTGLRWLYLDLNSYFASVEQQLNPRFRGKPLGVIPMWTRSTCCIAASYEAKAHGVKTGMAVWEALKICPQMKFVLADHEHYVRFHHEILKAVDKHIPVTKVESIDEVACALDRTQYEPAAAMELARRIKRQIRDDVGECLTSSIGIGPNRFLAKVATELQKPDGLVVIEPQDLPGKLLSLKLRDLPGIGRSMEKRLAAAHIHDILDLWNLSGKQARKVWGSVMGERFWLALHGIEIPDTPHPRRSIGHSRILSPEWRDPIRAADVAAKLTIKAASRLRRLDYFARSLSLYMVRPDYSGWQGAVRMPAVRDHPVILAALRRLWADGMRALDGSRLKQVGIVLSELVPAAEHIPDLFDPNQARRDRLSDVMDKINVKYGRDTVVLGRLPHELYEISGTKVAFTRIPDVEEFTE